MTDDRKKAEHEKLRLIGNGLRRACAPDDETPEDMAKLIDQLKDFDRLAK